MSEEKNRELAEVKAQVQAFVQSRFDEPVIVTSAVVCYEVLMPGEDGKMRRTIDYSSLSEDPSFSSDYGVVAVVQAQLIAIGVQMGEENDEE